MVYEMLFSKEPYRSAIEELVSEHYGIEWKIKISKDLKEFASHPAAILSDGTTQVFVKLSDATNGVDQFQVEVAGLKYLNERAGVLTVDPIGVIELSQATLLVLKAEQEIPRGAQQWRDIGRTLARIHQVKGHWCGLETQGYFGSLYQDNRPIRDWIPFFTERRIWPRLMGAIDSGNLPTELIRLAEKVIVNLSHLGIPESEPCLLHGDAQQNNFISTEKGAVVIDPAVYYGYAEMDLAYVDFFQPVPEEVFEGYQEIRPIDPGFKERRELWRIPAYLAMISVGEPGYHEKLKEALSGYL